jgi:cysteine desulfurase
MHDRAERPIYLDYNATTPIDPAVAAAMATYLAPGLAGAFGNPSSAHSFGPQPDSAARRARVQVADLIGCDPDEVIFTSGGSEADNLALKGAFDTRGGGHIVTSLSEHPAIINACHYLARRGARVAYVGTDERGIVDPGEIERVLAPDTFLVSIMLANNETGVIEPLAEIVSIAHARGILVHTDAAQAVGKIPVRVRDLGVDLLTIAGHKLYAPKGVGALYVRRGVALEPLIHGGGQERGLRAGTENVPYIAGLGAACETAGRGLSAEAVRLRGLRDHLHGLLSSAVAGLALNGHETRRLPNTLNVSFPGVDGAALLAATPEIAASTGSACHAGRTEPSDVLLSMGISPERALGAVRLSLGRYTTRADVDAAATALIETWRSLVDETRRSRGTIE